MAEAESSSHVYKANWSKLPKDDVIDKVKGILYGQAIGDAIGLATEFMTKAEAKKYYGKNGPSGYKVIVPDMHRARWLQGDWTDDTDQMLLILLGVIDNNGKVLKENFAKRMWNWTREGYAELGDRGGLGIGMTTHRTINHQIFLDDPHKAANDIWESSNRFLAANGAAMRTSVLGIVNFNDLEKVWENTKEISLTTHADPRCTASCIAITTAIALMLQGEFDPMVKKSLNQLVQRCLEKASEYLTINDHKKELIDHAQAKSWDKLKLDDRRTMGYTFKTMGAGFYALQTSKDFRKTIMELVMEAGDADTNGAVAGAMMGCKFGFKKLPEDLLEFPHRKWLDRKVQQFLVTIGLADQQQSGVDQQAGKGRDQEENQSEKEDHTAKTDQNTRDDNQEEVMDQRAETGDKNQDVNTKDESEGVTANQEEKAVDSNASKDQENEGQDAVNTNQDTTSPDQAATNQSDQKVTTEPMDHSTTTASSDE